MTLQPKGGRKESRKLSPLPPLGALFLRPPFPPPNFLGSETPNRRPPGREKIPLLLYTSQRMDSRSGGRRKTVVRVFEMKDLCGKGKKVFEEWDGVI